MLQRSERYVGALLIDPEGKNPSVEVSFYNPGSSHNPAKNLHPAISGLAILVSVGLFLVLRRMAESAVIGLASWEFVLIGVALLGSTVACGFILPRSVKEDRGIVANPVDNPDGSYSITVRLNCDAASAIGRLTIGPAGLKFDSENFLMQIGVAEIAVTPKALKIFTTGWRLNLPAGFPERRIKIPDWSVRIGLSDRLRFAERLHEWLHSDAKPNTVLFPPVLAHYQRPGRFRHKTAFQVAGLLAIIGILAAAILNTTVFFPIVYSFGIVAVFCLVCAFIGRSLEVKAPSQLQELSMKFIRPVNSEMRH